MHSNPYRRRAVTSSATCETIRAEVLLVNVTVLFGTVTDVLLVNETSVLFGNMIAVWGGVKDHGVGFEHIDVRGRGRQPVWYALLLSADRVGFAVHGCDAVL